MEEKLLFKTLTDAELQTIDAGGLFLAFLSGIATVAASIGAAYAAPPGTKFTTVRNIVVGGIFLTLGAYEMDCF